MTPDDVVVGAIERSRAHAEGVLHRSGMIFLSRSDGRILIQRRSRSRETFPDLYDSSCSFHVSSGETNEDAAKRELLEETGISASLRYLGKFTHYDPPENEIVAVYACVSDESVQISREESSDAVFYTRDDVDRIIRNASTPWLRDGWTLAKERI